MFITIILTLIIMIVIILEINYLGYFVVSKSEIFSGKAYHNFLSGAILYLFITAACFSPFIFYEINSIYLAFIFLVKDFIIISFLIARKDVFTNRKINLIPHSIGIVGGSLIYILFRFAFPETRTFKYDYDVNSSFLIENITKSLSRITFSTQTFALKNILWPFMSFVAFITPIALVSVIFKNNSWIYFMAGSISSLFIIYSYQFGLSPISFGAMTLLLFLFSLSYHLILFSRRRYGSFAGVATLTIWSIDSDTLLPLLALNIAASIVYIVLSKPKGAFFTFQLIAPLILIATLSIRKISNELAIVIFTLIIIFYISIFYFNRYSFIYENRIIKWLILSMPAILFATILITAIIFGGIKGNFGWQYFIRDNYFMYNFKNEVLSYIFTASYYIILLFTIYWVMKIYYYKKGVNSRKITVLICFFLMLLAYSPQTKYLLSNTFDEKSFNMIAYITYVPLIIMGISQSYTYISSKLFKGPFMTFMKRQN